MTTNRKIYNGRNQENAILVRYTDCLQRPLILVQAFNHGWGKYYGNKAKGIDSLFLQTYESLGTKYSL